MKNLILLATLLFGLTACSVGQDLRTALDDVSDLLQDAGANVQRGKRILTVDGKTIQLTVSSSNTSKPESFSINPNPNGVEIIGETELALEDGLYYMLEQLGYRFLLAGPNWTSVPQSLDWSKVTSVNTSPDYISREFFPGYIDFPYEKFGSQSDLTGDMEKWQRRLRIRQGIKIVRGHYGGQFNRTYKQQISSNAELRPEINGNRIAWNPNMKLCYTDQATIDLYIQDANKRLAEVAKSGQRKPWFLNVEPTDGLNHCECSECLAAGTVSDRVFTMANAVAAAVGDAENGIYVCVLAYAGHADVPEADIDPSLFVSVAPFDYQEITSGGVLLNQWSDKTDNLALREYWQLANTLDLPQFNYLDDLPLIVSSAQDLGYSAFISEATSGLVAGMIQYIASRVLWDSDADPETIMNEYCDVAFGNASVPMRKMYRLFARGFDIDTDISLVRKYLTSATSASGLTQEETKRLTDVEVYVQYLELTQAYLATKSQQSVHELVDFIWATHARQVVSAWPVSQAIEKRRKEDLSATSYGQAVEKMNSGGGSRQGSIPELNDEEVLAASPEVDLTDVVEYEVVQTNVKEWDPISGFDAGASPSNAIYDFNNSEMVFYVSGPAGQTFTMPFAVKSNAQNRACTVVVTDGNGNELHREGFDVGDQNQLTFEHTGQVLRMEFIMRATRVQMTQPAGIFAAAGAMRAGQGFPRKFFFTVPSGTDRLVVRLPKNTAASTLSLDGAQLGTMQTSGDKEVFEFIFNSTNSDRLAVLSTRAGAFEIVNVPHVVSLDSKGLPRYNK